MLYEVAQSEGIACQMFPWSEGVAWVSWVTCIIYWEGGVDPWRVGVDS